MAIAFDVVSESHTGTTGSTNQSSFTWSHAGGASARGALVFVYSALSSTHYVTSVTYGGVTMTEVPYSANAISAEPGAIKAFYLDNCGTGSKNVVVNRTNNTTVMYAICHTVTAGAGATTEVFLPGVVTRGGSAVATGATVTAVNALVSPGVQAVHDGSPGTNSLRFAGLFFGGASVIGGGTGSTTSINIDFGAYTCNAVRETTAGQGSRDVGFVTATGDDICAIYLAVREAVGATVEHDASSISAIGSYTSSHTWIHVPVGTPKGVLVFVETLGGAPIATGVTYGGVPMLAHLPAGAGTVSATGQSLQTFFLGSGIPTGSQTVAIARPSNGDSTYGYCTTVTAPGDTDLIGTEALSGTSTQSQQTVNDGTPDTPASKRYAVVARYHTVVGTTGIDSVLLRSHGSFAGYTAAFFTEIGTGKGDRLVGSTDSYSTNYCQISTAVRGVTAKAGAAESGTATDTASVNTGSTEKTGAAESGTGSDTASLAAARSATAESGTGSDTASLAVARSATAESGTGSDSSYLTQTKTGAAESGTGSDTAALAVARSGASETGTGSDTAALAAARSATAETGTGSDTASVSQGVTEKTGAAETGTGSESSYLTQTKTGTAESGTGSDTASLAVAQSGMAESGTASDSSYLTQTKAGSAESGTGSDTASLAAARSGAAESGTGSDTASAPVVAASGSDSGTASDTSSVNQGTIDKSGSDSGTASDTASLVKPVAGSDSGTATDTAALAAALTLGGSPGVVSSVSLGSAHSPVGLVFSPDGAYIYVVNASARNVEKISVSSMSVVATYSCATNVYPSRVAVSPDGTYVYCSFSNSSTQIGGVLKIATSTMTLSLTYTMPTYGTGDALCVSPDGSYVYVAAGNSVDLHKVTASNMTIVGSTCPITPNAQPQSVSINSDGSRVIIAEANTNYADVVNTSTMAVIDTANPWPETGVAGGAWAPNGTYYYLCGTTNDRLYRVDTTDSYSMSSYASLDDGSGTTDPLNVVISSDSSTAYVAGGTGVTIVDLASLTQVGFVSLSGYSAHLALSPDGEWVAVSRYNDNLVTRVDLGGPSEKGTASESAVVDQSKSGSETGTATDTASAPAVARSTSDSGTASESSILDKVGEDAQKSASETGTGSETAALVVVLTGTAESGVGADTAALPERGYISSDSGTLSESSMLETAPGIVVYGTAERGTLLESLHVTKDLQFTLQEQGAGVETARVIDIGEELAKKYARKGLGIGRDYKQRDAKAL